MFSNDHKNRTAKETRKLLSHLPFSNTYPSRLLPFSSADLPFVHSPSLTTPSQPRLCRSLVFLYTDYHLMRESLGTHVCTCPCRRRGRRVLDGRPPGARGTRWGRCAGRPRRRAEPPAPNSVQSSAHSAASGSGPADSACRPDSGSCRTSLWSVAPVSSLPPTPHIHRHPLHYTTLHFTSLGLQLCVGNCQVIEQEVQMSQQQPPEERAGGQKVQKDRIGREQVSWLWYYDVLHRNKYRMIELTIRRIMIVGSMIRKIGIGEQYHRPVCSENQEDTLVG